MEPRGEDRRKFKRGGEDRRSAFKPDPDKDWGNLFAISVGVGAGLGLTGLMWIISMLAPAGG